MVKVVNDLLIVADTGHVSLLLLLDLTAVFDTVSHNVPLSHMETLFGIKGIQLPWFKSYFARKGTVCVH